MEKISKEAARRVAAHLFVPWDSFERAARDVGAHVPVYGCKVYARRSGAVELWTVGGCAPDGSDVRDFFCLLSTVYPEKYLGA